VLASLRPKMEGDLIRGDESVLARFGEAHDGPSAVGEAARVSAHRAHDRKRALGPQ
jgi:hypothetical protein